MISFKDKLPVIAKDLASFSGFVILASLVLGLLDKNSALELRFHWGWLLGIGIAAYVLCLYLRGKNERH